MIKEFQGEYRFLSNFYLCPVKYNGLIYPSSENAYQAAKCKNESDKDYFTIIDPYRAKKLGKKIDVRDDWEQVKLQIMENIVRRKFKQNKELKKLLVYTDDQELIEGNKWYDFYWGICNGKGQNNLGKILMKVREQLK